MRCNFYNFLSKKKSAEILRTIFIFIHIKFNLNLKFRGWKIITSYIDAFDLSDRKFEIEIFFHERKEIPIVWGKKKEKKKE